MVNNNRQWSCNSVSYDIDADSGDASITGDWGTFTFDDGNEAMGVGGGDADSVSNMGIVGDNTILYSGGEAIGGGMIAYSNSSLEFHLVSVWVMVAQHLQLMKHHTVYLTHFCKWC